MATLGEYFKGKDNNFNLVRILAAFAVLLSHSYPLAAGKGAVEPLCRLLGQSLASLAVDVFFITSGFLVVASLVTRKHLRTFIRARILRIFPALLVVVFLTVFVVGPLLSSLPASSYLVHPKIMTYLLKCSTLISGVAMRLPGLFENNPYPQTVNGSLWTLKYEIIMYAVLAGGWAILRRTGRGSDQIFRRVVLACLLVATLASFGGLLNLWSVGPFTRFFFLFFCGASYYLWRDRIPFTAPIFWGIIVFLGLSALWMKPAFAWFYMLGVGYVVLFLALVPQGFIRHYNRVGDYSYGIYIYAFLVQQIIATFFRSITPGGMMLASSALTIPLAVLSWHLVEKAALARKEKTPSHVRAGVAVSDAL